METLEEKVNNTRNSLKTERLDMTFGEIIRMYEEEEIIIDPDYQRLFRWDSSKKTKFIESLLLGIPIPPIFVVEQKGTWEIVDGLQRISTVLSFCGSLNYLGDGKFRNNQKNYWRLEKGDLIEDIENLNYNNLSKELQFIIKRYVCRVEVIKSNSEYDMRYELFNRLNTGGVILTNQEIRNCIFRASSPKFNDFINEEGRKDKFIKLIDLPERKQDEMFLEELVLRFCSLYNATSIEHSISQHMTEFMKNTVKDDKKINELTEIWHRTINLLETQNREIFRAGRGIFSTVLYDGITVGLAQNIDKYDKKDTNNLSKKIAEIKENEKFKKCIGKLHSKDNLKKRLNIANEIFKD